MGVVDAYLVPVVDGVAYGLLLFVVAAGLMLAFAVGGVLNLAHGALFALGAYTAAALSDGTWTALVVTVAVGAVAGAVGGGALAAALAAQREPRGTSSEGAAAHPGGDPLRRRGHLAQALLTMGVAFVAADLLRAGFGPNDLPTMLPPALSGTASVAGHAYPAYRLAFIGVAALVAAAGWRLLTRSRAGAVVRAAVDDPDMLATLGVSPRAVNAAVLAASGALAGLAGALGAPILGAGPTTANTVLLISLVVVVLGGMRSVPATLLAALAVGQAQTLGVTLAAQAAPFLLFAAMAAVLIARSRDPLRGTP